jgi:limonene 1,2-monooxygenase
MYRLLADKVFPYFTEGSSALMRSYLWTKERKEGFSQRFDAGIAKAKSDYAANNAVTAKA